MIFYRVLQCDPSATHLLGMAKSQAERLINQGNNFFSKTIPIGDLTIKIDGSKSGENYTVKIYLVGSASVLILGLFNDSLDSQDITVTDDGKTKVTGSALSKSVKIDRARCAKAAYNAKKDANGVDNVISESAFYSSVVAMNGFVAMRVPKLTERDIEFRSVPFRTDPNARVTSESPLEIIASVPMQEVVQTFGKKTLDDFANPLRWARIGTLLKIEKDLDADGSFMKETLCWDKTVYLTILESETAGYAEIPLVFSQMITVFGTSYFSYGLPVGTYSVGPYEIRVYDRGLPVTSLIKIINTPNQNGNFPADFIAISETDFFQPNYFEFNLITHIPSAAGANLLYYNEFAYTGLQTISQAGLVAGKMRKAGSAIVKKVDNTQTILVTLKDFAPLYGGVAPEIKITYRRRDDKGKTLAVDPFNDKGFGISKLQVIGSWSTDKTTGKVTDNITNKLVQLSYGFFDTNDPSKNVVTLCEGMWVPQAGYEYFRVVPASMEFSNYIDTLQQKEEGTAPPPSLPYQSPYYFSLLELNTIEKKEVTAYNSRSRRVKGAIFSSSVTYYYSSYLLRTSGSPDAISTLTKANSFSISINQFLKKVELLPNGVWKVSDVQGDIKPFVYTTNGLGLYFVDANYSFVEKYSKQKIFYPTLSQSMSAFSSPQTISNKFIELPDWENTTNQDNFNTPITYPLKTIYADATYGYADLEAACLDLNLFSLRNNNPWVIKDAKTLIKGVDLTIAAQTPDQGTVDYDSLSVNTDSISQEFNKGYYGNNYFSGLRPIVTFGSSTQTILRTDFKATFQPLLPSDNTSSATFNTLGLFPVEDLDSMVKKSYAGKLTNCLILVYPKLTDKGITPLFAVYNTANGLYASDAPKFIGVASGSVAIVTSKLQTTLNSLTQRTSDPLEAQAASSIQTLLDKIATLKVPLTAAQTADAIKDAKAIEKYADTFFDAGRTLAASNYDFRELAKATGSFGLKYILPATY